MQNATGIRLERCGKTFADGTRALESLDLEIHAGETVVFLGPSGCGKTTLLRIIAGLEQPDGGGCVRFNDEDVTALPIERRNVGMVFQSYALFPNMTVSENVAYGLKIRRVDAAGRAREVTRLLDMMHLTDFGKRRVDQLSGGQRQRVALARALAVQPRVLLLDEPLTALDAKLRESLRVDIDRLLRTLGVTTVYVTHDQAEAMALGDRIAVMAKGKVAQIGTPHDIYYRPESGFVADFVGTMNRLTGAIVGHALQVADGAMPLPADWGHGAQVMFRPQDARLVEPSQGGVNGQIATAFFMGGFTRVVVELADGQSVTAETSERREYRKGQAVGVHVDPQSMLALRA